MSTKAFQNRVLGILKDRRLFKHEISKETNATRKRVDDVLNDLLEQGLVMRRKSGSWTVSAARIHHCRRAAVEKGGNIFPRPTWPTSGKGWWG